MRTRHLRTLSITLALAAVGCGPEVIRVDGGLDADTDLVDTGPRDTGPDLDAGPLDAGPAGNGIGDPCERDRDCASDVCFPAGFGQGVCTAACTTPSECPSGWTCGDFGGDDVCQCETDSETCNGDDDDCDGIVDEGRPESIGCGDGQTCTGGSCGCPAGGTCGGDCVNTQTDPRHCGGCDQPCNSGEVCTAGGCCAPSAEGCNGTDDDCDGVVDEGFGTAVGCGFAQACVSGACACPSDRMCGAECVDTLANASHCGGCGEACDAGEDCVDGICCDAVGARVDLLLMVDNSNSMSQEQASFAAQLPNLVRALATGDVNNDGTPESEPVRDLNVGVITTDMGTAGYSYVVCPESDFGDDGVLRTQGRADITGCNAVYPSFLNFVPTGGGNPTDFASEVACVAVAGTGGCGFEQPLEAVLKAVTSNTSPIRFFRNTVGHGDGANAGFLRADSILVTLLLTDENDCSAQDGEIFNPDSLTYTADLNLRCFEHPTALHPLSRYADGLLATRSDPRDLIFAQITGVPVSLTQPGQVPNYASLLAAPELQERIDPSEGSQLIASCNVPGRGVAFPPRRILRVGQALQDRGVTTVVGSICQENLASPVGDLLTRVSLRLRESCN